MIKDSLQTIDKLAITLIIILSLFIGFLVWQGKHCQDKCWFNNSPKVKNFSWQGKEIGAEDRAFIITFDLPMERKSVEENLVIKPELSGRFSWAGKRVAYTLNSPAPYGENYQLSLSNGKTTFRDQAPRPMLPFVGQFKTRDRSFAYIGSQAEEKGRLILYNLTKNEKTILTPPDLVVVDFQPYSSGDRLIFSAADANSGLDSLQELQIYSIDIEKVKKDPVNSKKYLTLILDNKEYQNNQFDLSEDGKTIVVQRINRQNPADFDLWMVKSDQPPQPLKVTGGDFLIAPDSQTLAVAQGEGIGLLPLEKNAQPLDFLPKFGQILSFSKDGTAAAMVNFNMDNANLRYMRSLYYVNNQGVQKQLLNVRGSIVNCQFNPNATLLYCLLTELQSSEEYIEKPYFVEIDLKTAKGVPLVELPNYQDIHVSVAPDGLGILFDQVITANITDAQYPLTTDSGESIVGGSLWLLIPSSVTQSHQSELQELPLIGFNPRWLP
jgi:hypothetical protein